MYTVADTRVKAREARTADILRAWQALAIGTCLGFLIFLLRPLLRPDQEIPKDYCNASRPPHALDEALVLLFALGIHLDF
jgi:hypothetical protein